MSTVIENLNKKFGSFTALNNVSVKIEDGEFIAILGPSGCGKTTLLRILAGFEAPTKGTVSIDGNIVSKDNLILPSEKRNIGMVFQNFALWPHMKVKEHIEFPLKNHKAVEDEVRKQPEKRVDEILQILSLENLKSRLPGQLSGGQKQRVALGRAIAPKPKLLLMDEPLSSLDAELRMEMRREIMKIHRSTKSSIVYVTHDQGEALAMADRIIVMKDGNLEQVGTPYEIYYEPETEFVASFVSKANIIKGKWENEEFILDNTNIIWTNKNINKRLKEKGIYPIRPEEIAFSKDTDGLKGKIETKQFQGKEYHYSVTTDVGLIILYDTLGKYNQGDEVYLIPKEK